LFPIVLIVEFLGDVPFFDRRVQGVEEDALSPGFEADLSTPVNSQATAVVLRRSQIFQSWQQPECEREHYFKETGRHFHGYFLCGGAVVKWYSARKQIRAPGSRQIDILWNKKKRAVD
jgi:hypothetical protein